MVSLDDLNCSAFTGSIEHKVWDISFNAFDVMYLPERCQVAQLSRARITASCGRWTVREMYGDRIPLCIHFQVVGAFDETCFCGPTASDITRSLGFGPVGWPWRSLFFFLSYPFIQDAFRSRYYDTDADALSSGLEIWTYCLSVRVM